MIHLVDAPHTNLQSILKIKHWRPKELTIKKKSLRFKSTRFYMRYDAYLCVSIRFQGISKLCVRMRLCASKNIFVRISMRFNAFINFSSLSHKIARIGSQRGNSSKFVHFRPFYAHFKEFWSISAHFLVADGGRQLAWPHWVIWPSLTKSDNFLCKQNRTKILPFQKKLQSKSINFILFKINTFLSSFLWAD